MSLKSFLQGIWESISKFFEGLLPTLQTAVSIGVSVATAIENFDTSNPEVADVITSLIPGTVDDTILADIRTALPKIVIELQLVDATLGLTDPNQIMLAAVKVIQGLDGDFKSAFLHNISILVSQVAADGKLTWSDAVYLVQWYYENKSGAQTTVPAATATA